MLHIARNCAGLVLVASLSACSNAALRAAEHGDAARLSALIAEKHAKGKLSNGEARDLARAVALRELEVTKDAQTASERLTELRDCTHELGLDDVDYRWHDLVSYTLKRSGDRDVRQAALVDPSARVRRSALRASEKADDASDLDVLFESARVDPDSELRRDAVLAISAILRGLGREGRVHAADFVVRFRDLWTTGDEPLKRAVATAWNSAPMFESGGRDALRAAIAEGHGPGALQAAGVVLRAAHDDADLVGSASALLVRTIAAGSHGDRLRALTEVRLEGTMLEAVRTAAHDNDKLVSVRALTLLLGSEADREGAKRELYTFARYGTKATRAADDGRARELGQLARQALAEARELGVQAWIEEDLEGPAPETKLAAASALAALGRPARAAPLLVDPSVGVRMHAVCILVRRR